MKNTQKKFLSAVLAASSVAGVVAPAVTTFAATATEVDTLVASALTAKTFYDFNNAYAAVMALPADQQGKYLDKLAPLVDVVRPKGGAVDVAMLANDEFVKTQDMALYNKILKELIPQITNVVDRTYVNDELGKWGKIYIEKQQPEYIAATDAIMAVDTALAAGKLDEAKTLVTAAQAAIAKVTHKANSAYLTTITLPEVVTRLDKAVAASTLAVSSVTATGLKEVVVSFSKPVDATEAAKVANYSVKNETVSLATVSSDKMTVTLTLAGNLDQQQEVEVTVKKALGLTADAVLKFTIMDVNIPVTQTIKLTGPNTFEITFSEPVQEGDSPEVLINNGVYGVTSKTLSADKKTLTVTLSASTLSEGTYSVKVSGYKDYANFAAMSKTFDLVYVKDTTAPTATLKSASQTEVKVTFDKAVTQKGGSPLTKDYFYQTYSAWKPYAVTTTDNKTFTLAFTDSDDTTVDPILPEGNIVVTVLKTVSDKAVVDAWGNELGADAKLTATIAADKTAPTVKSVEATAEDKIKVVFSEDVKTLANSNFVIKDADGKVVSQTITSIDYDADKYEAVLNLSGKLSGGSYSVEVKDVVDKALSANKITAVTNSISVTDKTAIDLTAVTSVVVDNATAKEQYVYVTFPEKVTMDGANGALNKDNYLIAGTKLASGDKIEAFGAEGKRIKITVPYRGTTPAAVITADTTELTVGRISDAVGNTPTLIAYAKAIANDTAPTAIYSAKAVALNKVELVFAAELKTVIAEGITVDNGDGTFASVAAIDSVVVKDGKTTVTATVKAEEKLADKSASKLADFKVKVVADKLETITGKKLGDIAATSVTDGIAPEYTGTVTLARTSANVATIGFSFDEALKDSLSTDLIATDLVVQDANGKVYVAAVDYTVAYTGADVTITLTLKDEATLDKLNGTKLTIGTKPTVTYIKDAANNNVKAFEGKTTSTTLANN